MPHGDGGGSKVSFLLPGGSQALGSIRITWTAVVVKASIPGLVPLPPPQESQILQIRGGAQECAFLASSQGLAKLVRDNTLRGTVLWRTWGGVGGGGR